VGPQSWTHIRTAYYYWNTVSNEGLPIMPKIKNLAQSKQEATGPRSLMRLLGLFGALAKSPKDGLGLAELNLVLNSPKSSLLNLLRPLVATGYLNLESGRYRLGPSMFRLSGTIMSVWNFSNTVRPFLQELAERSRESVYLGVLDRAGKVITYVDAIDSPHSVRYSVPVGAVRPLYCTAAGRVLLAFAEKTWQEQYVSTTKLEPRTPRTIATQKGLREELERVRKTQISVSIGEMFPEAAAISAPVFGADGNLAAAIAVGGPTERLNPRIAELRPIITDVAKRASGHGTDLPKAVENITPARRAPGKRVAAA
jgi:IclR family acetate operon transcriptional repressor